MLGIKSLTQTGDTIVEVLLALAILGSAFGISYATANHSLVNARNAEEHSQALQYIDKQLELLRSAAGNDDAATAGIFSPVINGKAFCLTQTSPVGIVLLNNNWLPATKSADEDLQNAPDNYRPQCTQAGPPYYISLTYAPGTNDDVFQVLVRWQGLGTLGAQQESLSYKLHP